MKVRTSFYIEKNLIEALKKEAKKSERPSGYILAELLRRRYGKKV